MVHARSSKASATTPVESEPPSSPCSSDTQYLHLFNTTDLREHQSNVVEDKRGANAAAAEGGIAVRPWDEALPQPSLKAIIPARPKAQPRLHTSNGLPEVLELHTGRADPDTMQQIEEICGAGFMQSPEDQIMSSSLRIVSSSLPPECLVR